MWHDRRVPTDLPDLRVEHGTDGAGWRTVLRSLAAPQPEPAADGPATTGVLGLQLELRELTPHTRERWNGPTSRRVTAVRGPARPGRASGGSPAAGTAPASAGAEGGPAQGMLRLGARPVLRTPRGWARGNLTWSNVAHMRHRLDLDAEQHRWFCQLGAFHRAAGPAVPGADLDWVHLDDFTNPVLWDLLAQARELGVELVGSGAGADVRLAGRAELDLDVAQEARGVVVRARLRVDGAPAPVGHAHVIGTHGVYLVDLARPNRLVLAPAARTWTAQQLVLLGAGPEGDRELADVLAGGLVVPPDAAGELVDEHLPALLAGLDVVSADRTVVLPPPAPPTLVVTVRHRPRRTVDLSWRWDGHARSAPAPDPRTLLPADVRAALGWSDATGVVRTVDGTAVEGAAVGGTSVGGTGAPSSALPGPVTLRDEDAAELVTTTLPRLEGLPGVRVETVGTAPDYRRLDGPPVLTVTTYETQKHDWFDLGVSVQVDGRAVPFAPLFAALAGGKRRLLLVDGTYLRLDHPVLAPLAALIAEARDLAEWETGPRISRHQTSLWSDLVDVADEAVPAPAWQALLADVAQGTPRATPLPRGLRATLRPYQREGYHWLTSLWRHRIGGILADDMGLGKTLQCLALVQHAVEERGVDEPRRPFLVVAPTSVVPGWVAEAARFTPGLRVRRLRATEAGGGARVADAAADADVVVTSYALLRLDADAYRDVARGTGWAGLVLDEAQQVKNATSLVHAAARDLEVPFTLAVTGTPMENSLTELHALLALTVPGLFPSARGFVEQYVRPVEGVRTGITAGPGGGEDVGADVARVRTERLARLRRRVRPFLLRRTKELVAADLPAKQEQTLTVELTPAHREVYDRYLQRERAKLFGLIDDLDRQRFIVYRSLTLLRMLALDPALIDAALVDPGRGGGRSAKLDALLEQLEDVVAEGHRALVFSQFTSYLALVGDALRAAGVPFVQLDGSTVRREEVVEEFRTGAAPVFLISLKAGGTGLNLTEADYVFLLDPWWNPASEQQAVDRTHRIGQRRTVMVYRMIAAGTIEEKVVALQARKAALVDAVVDDGDLFASTLTADEVRELLA